MDITSDKVFIYAAYVFFFLLAIIFSLLTNGLLLRFAKTLGIRQEQLPDSIRWSSDVKPSVGGFSFYILFLIALSVFGIFNFAGSQYLNKHLLGMVFSVSLGFLIGLADDAYNTYPVLKLIGQLLCAFFLLATGTIIHATNIFSIDALITAVWVVGIMNSINMLDNMDGVSATVSLMILGTCYLILGIEGNLFSFYSLVLLGVSGALVGFLFYNWNPARIYMGDTGSMFLGAFLSSVSIPVLWKYHDSGVSMISFRQFIIPMLVFIVPIIDTSTVFFRRISRGQSPFVGGKDHVTHHLVYVGLSERQANYVLGGISLFSGLLAGVLVWLGNQAQRVVVAAFYLYFVIVFAAIQYFYNKGKRKRDQQLHSSPLN